LSYTLEDSVALVAEYVTVPYIRIEDENGYAVTDLGDFVNETKSYFVGGISLTAQLKVYPPESFEISTDETTWTANPSYIEIAAVIANASMTEIFVRHNE